MNFTAEQIAEATGGTVVKDGGAGRIHTDSRTSEAGDWFLAIVGERFDGHDVLASLVEPVGVIVDRDVDVVCGVIRVEDTTKAFADLARAARDRLKGPVVWLTGSAGKTTTRALIACALSPLGDIHQTVGNLNNHFGVPMTLVAAPVVASASVVEMGTSGPGEIALLSSIGRPDIRLIVNIGASHLEELGGLPGVADEKGVLFEQARPGDICCVNLDDPYIRAMTIPTHAGVITYGTAEDARVRLLEARIDPVVLSTQMAFEIDGKAHFCALPTPGVHMAHNAAGALAVALAAGVDPAQACEAMAAYKPVGMRMAIEALPKGVTAFNDCYNANPTSMEASLRMFASLPGRKVAVLGDMLELGDDEARFHDEIAELAVRLRLNRVLLVGPRMSLALQGVDAGRVERAVDGTLLAGPLADWLRAGDRVLFKGSRGAKVERILQALSHALASSTEVS